MHWPAPERRLAGRQCLQKLREGGRGRDQEGDEREGEGEGGRGWISERKQAEIISAGHTFCPGWRLHPG
jgi:hypothetical protein